MSKYLKTKFFNIDFDNPLISLSGCYGYGNEFKDFIKPKSLGAITLKGLTLEPRDGNQGVRIAETPSGILNCIGLENPGMNKFVNEIYPHLDFNENIIININGNTIEEYEEMARQINNLKEIKMVELNISCPNVKCGGMSFGTDKKVVKEITSRIKKILKNKILIVKLSPNVSDIKEIALAAQEGGADALCLINTLLGMEIDIKNKKPLLGNTFGGLSGPAVFPIALRMVYQVYQVVKIPIIACGGVSNYEDVIKMIMAGASLVGLGTILLTKPAIIEKIVNDLILYCKENKINNIFELQGIAHRKE